MRMRSAAAALPPPSPARPPARPPAGHPQRALLPVALLRPSPAPLALGCHRLNIRPASADPFILLRLAWLTSVQLEV
ncbi:unnamed protein product [Urochloa humidicola]